jgi:cell division protein FtsZ
MINDTVNFKFEKKPGSIIKVIGVGGGGGNAINHMFTLGIRDVDFIVCNTDSQALINSPVPSKVHLGSSLTEGRGAGNKPEIGRQAAKENIEDVKKVLEPNTKMVFITAGMGGGTGTGGAPVIAALCREMGFLTIGIVTIPFRNEGKRRINQAIEGIQEMEQYVDSLLVINNERIREMYGDFAISQAFAKADDVLATAAKGIAEIITVPGYINVDFADVETVMRNSGVAIMGTGLAEGKGRAVRAVEQALNSPLLNNNNIRGARNILLNVNSGKTEVTMDEIGEITDFIQTKAGFEADLIWGNGIDEKLGDEISVTVIATGFSTSSIPEILSTKKAEKQKFELNSREPVKTATEVTQKLPAPDKPTFPSEKRTAPEFNVDSHQARKADWELLYDNAPAQPKEITPKHRVEIDYTRMSEEDVEKLENVPAYERKQILAKQQGGALKSSDYSKYSVSADSKKKIVFKDSNPYLHTNID